MSDAETAIIRANQLRNEAAVEIVTLRQKLNERDQRIAALEAQLAAWHSQFGTTQLTHAIAKMEALEKRCAELQLQVKNLTYHDKKAMERVSELEAQSLDDGIELNQLKNNLASLLKPTCELLDRIEAYLIRNWNVILKDEVQQERQRLEGICKP